MKPVDISERCKIIMKCKTAAPEKIADHRKNGGSPLLCAVFTANMGLVDDAELSSIFADCTGGKILCGKCKRDTIDRMMGITVTNEKTEDTTPIEEETPIEAPIEDNTPVTCFPGEKDENVKTINIRETFGYRSGNGLSHNNKPDISDKAIHQAVRLDNRDVETVDICKTFGYRKKKNPRRRRHKVGSDWQ